MAQNIKCVLNDYKSNKNQTNMLFGETVKIKTGSSIALTNFNASFDISKQVRTINEQKFDFYPNFYQTIDAPKREITFPTKKYTSYETFKYDFENLVNKNLPSYNRDLVYENRTNFTGMVFSAKTINSKAIFSLDTYPLVQPLLSLTEGLTLNEETNEYEGEGDVSLFGVNPFLAKCGGVNYQFNLRLNTPNSNKTSYVELYKDNGDYIRLVYQTVVGAGVGRPLLSVVVFQNGETTTYPIRDEFYDYYTVMYINGETLPTGEKGAWSQSTLSQTNAWIFYQNNGKWSIVYEDNEQDIYVDVVVDTVFKWNLEDNYNVRKVIKNNTNFLANTTYATQALSPFLEGFVARKSKMEFETDYADQLLQIFGLNGLCLFTPEQNYSSIYTPLFTLEFYTLQNFELALEIDTIKLKNYTSYTNTDKDYKGSRKNIIAYFTPFTTIGSAKYIYSYQPPEAIYLLVDNTNDIDLSSMNIRIYNTYTNEPFVADSITFTLTNI
jgi:hypothetical protein